MVEKPQADNGREVIGDRQAVLAVLAKAGGEDLAAAWEAIENKPEIDILRQPEFGMVMARGRTGGGGAAFNLGEVTVTRATVRLDTGEVGVGHVLGRDRKRALLVARFDALWQSPAYRDAVEAAVLRPVVAKMARQDAATRARTQATRVNFFTMVRGEDP